jgi:hypothetical protein
MTLRRRTAWAWIGLLLVVLAAGNAHLVYVAISSQPACLAPAGEGSHTPAMPDCGAP